MCSLGAVRKLTNDRIGRYRNASMENIMKTDSKFSQNIEYLRTLKNAGIEMHFFFFITKAKNREIFPSFSLSFCDGKATSAL